MVPKFEFTTAEGQGPYSLSITRPEETRHAKENAGIFLDPETEYRKHQQESCPPGMLSSKRRIVSGLAATEMQNGNQNSFFFNVPMFSLIIRGDKW